VINPDPLVNSERESHGGSLAYWCDKFAKPDDPDPSRDDDYEGWSRCTRKCLQDCDAAENAEVSSAGV
jgi:hypothetical protein